jgi:hypothetical protein
VTGDTVPAASHGDDQTVAAGEVHCSDDIGDALASHDAGRPAVDHAVPDPARRVELRVARAQKCASERFAKR